MKQHKWHKEIKAWADGAEIEVFVGRTWELEKKPEWYESLEYRIKPQPKEPQYLYVYKHFKSGMLDFSLVNENNSPNVEDGQMIYVGKIKLETEE